MLAISVSLILSFQAEVSTDVSVMTKLEVNMKATIELMCVVAGTALLGRSG
jgi:hypothetical protein